MLVMIITNKIFKKNAQKNIRLKEFQELKIFDYG